MRQYANSPTIQTLIGYFQQDINADKFLEDFYNDVWDLETCGTYGLDVWGKIVNISRYLEVPEEPNVFGFETSDNAWFPFNNQPFATSQTTTQTYRLEDDAYRTLIYAKAMSNVFGRSCKNFNRMLSILFKDRGGCYVLDLGNMRIRFVFEFYLEPYEKLIIENRNVFPRPAGVLDDYLEIPPYDYFGFDVEGGTYQPFNQAVFFSGNSDAI